MLGISDAITLTQKISDLIKAGATMELKEKIVELREAVLNAKEEILALRAENLALKTKEHEADNWGATVAAYPLVKAPGGAMVRRTDGPPEHYACPKCFEDRKVYPLQDKGVYSGSWDCPSCGESFTVGVPRTPRIDLGSPGGTWSSR